MCKATLQKGGFHCDTIEEQLCDPKEPLSEQFLKEPGFFS